MSQGFKTMKPEGAPDVWVCICNKCGRQDEQEVSVKRGSPCITLPLGWIQITCPDMAEGDVVLDHSDYDYLIYDICEECRSGAFAMLDEIIKIPEHQIWPSFRSEAA